MIMTVDAWLTLAVVAASLVLLVRDALPPAVVLLGGVITLVVTGVLDGEAAFSGFALAKALAQPVGGVLVDRVRRASLLGLFGRCLTAATIVGLAFAGAGGPGLVWRVARGGAAGAAGCWGEGAERGEPAGAPRAQVAARRQPQAAVPFAELAVLVAAAEDVGVEQVGAAQKASRKRTPWSARSWRFGVGT